MDLSKVNRDYIVSKNNKLIQSKFDLSLNEQKIVLILASTVQPEDDDFNEVTTSITQLAKILNVSRDNLYRDIPKITKNLMGKVLEIKEPLPSGKIKLIQTHFLETAIYNGDEGSVYLRFSKELKPYLLELKDLFTSYRLGNALSLTSKYAIRMYEELKANEFKGNFIWTLEDLKYSLILTASSYQRYNNIKNKVIEPSIKEINEKTDLKVSYKEIKQGRSVKELLFTIKGTVDPNKVNIDSNGNKPIDGQTSIDDYIIPDFSVLPDKETEQFENFMNEHGALGVRAIEIMKSKSKAKTIKGKINYAKKVLETLKEEYKLQEERINPKSFNNFKGRDYDYDDLEKKLLGWDK